jgi:hypothetical protein
MLHAPEKAKAALNYQSDLENSFYTWQMSWNKYVHKKCECQVNAINADQARCRTKLTGSKLLQAE